MPNIECFTIFSKTSKSNMAAKFNSNLKKCLQGDFWGFWYLESRHTQVSFLKKSAFCNFFPGSLYIFSNALGLSRNCFVTGRRREGGRGRGPSKINVFAITYLCKFSFQTCEKQSLITLQKTII